MINTYLAGSLVRVANYAGSVAAPIGGFRDSSSALIDPDVVLLKYKPGVLASLVVITYPAFPVVRDAQGLYHADLDTTGFLTTTWAYAWAGTGVGQAIAGSSFNVTADAL